MPLVDLGFTKQAEGVYRTLLAHPELTVAELAAEVGLPECEVCEAVSSLVELGIAAAAAGSPAGVRLLNPTHGLGQLIERREDELLRAQRRIGDMRAEVPDLAAQFTRHLGDRRERPDVLTITDLPTVRETLEELSFFTRTSVFCVQPGGPQSAKGLAASRPLDLRGLRRGIDMRIVYETSVLGDELNRGYLREITSLGAQARVTDETLERMIIMDEQVAVIPIDPANSSLGALVVRQAGLIKGFLRLFHRIWNEAGELPWNGPAEPVEEITDEDRRVLAFLASGCTDEVAARELSVSVRHLRRRVARLMELLSASSRFEAGVEATRRGWI